MNVGKVLGLICIAVAFVLAVFEEAFLFPPLVWFLAAIAFVLVLGATSVGIPGRKGPSE